MSEVRAHYLNYLEGEVVCGVGCVDDLDLLGPQHRGHVATRDLLYGPCGVYKVLYSYIKLF